MLARADISGVEVARTGQPVLAEELHGRVRALRNVCLTFEISALTSFEYHQLFAIFPKSIQLHPHQARALCVPHHPFSALVGCH